jgi:hypothetical protein
MAFSFFLAAPTAFHINNIARGFAQCKKKITLFLFLFVGVDGG